MDMYNLGNISQSIINQINTGVTISQNTNLHLQRGEKVISSVTDNAAFSQKQSILNSIEKNRSTIQNFQNALSFAQVQDAALASVGSMITRMMELKTTYEGIVSSTYEKSAYDEEFKELQMQVKNIREMKFNGISLFSHSGNQSVVQKSQNINSLVADSSQNADSMVIDRAGLFGALQVTKEFAPDNELINATGGPDEFRLVKDLKSSSGELTWWQWAYRASDNFQAFHGSEKIHDKTYGEAFVGPDLLNNGRVLIPEPGSHNGGAAGFPDSDWIKDPARYDKNKDVIEFGRNGNSATTIEFLVNESGQVSGTGWHMEYRIDYDPITIDLLDDSKLYSLTEVDISDLQFFEGQLSYSRGENGSTQQRIIREIQNLEDKLIKQDSHLERLDGLDIARTMSELNVAQTKLNLNTRLIKSAQELENKLYTDFL